MTLNMIILFYPDSSLSFLQSFADFRIPLNINSFLFFISLFVVYNNISMFIQQFFSHNVKYDKLTEIINGDLSELNNTLKLEDNKSKLSS